MSREIYFDRSETNPEDLEKLQARLSEHQSKISLGQVRRNETFPGLINVIGNDTNKVAVQYITAVEYDSRNQTDGQWVVSMIKAGIPIKLILETWELKDESERNLPH